MCLICSWYLNVNIQNKTFFLFVSLVLLKHSRNLYIDKNVLWLKSVYLKKNGLLNFFTIISANTLIVIRNEQKLTLCDWPNIYIVSQNQLNFVSSDFRYLFFKFKFLGAILFYSIFKFVNPSLFTLTELALDVYEEPHV